MHSPSWLRVNYEIALQIRFPLVLPSHGLLTESTKSPSPSLSPKAKVARLGARSVSEISLSEISPLVADPLPGLVC
jgi:hypothetical protein